MSVIIWICGFMLKEREKTRAWRVIGIGTSECDDEEG